MEDTQHYRELIRRTRERLKALQEQKASYGYAAPPHIENEIAQCHKDIELYNAHLWSGAQPSEKAQNEVPGDSDIVLLKYQVSQLRELVKDALTSLKEEQKSTIGAIQAQISYNNEEAVRWRSEERAQRKAGQEEYAGRLERVETTVRALAEWQQRLTQTARSVVSRAGWITVIILVAILAFYLGSRVMR